MPLEHGEFVLIDQMLSSLPHLPASVRVGPGDDAAVTDPPRGAMVLTADLLIEGRHFDLAFSSAEDVGYKAIAVNVSDLAAMGATPLYALVSIGLPVPAPEALGRAVYAGIAQASETFGISVVGGDTVGADLLTISVAAIGQADTTVTRAGAREGDVLCVTGAVGGAAAALMLFRAQADPEARILLERSSVLAEAHRRARARVREGIEAATAGATAMIDVSDGLAADTAHIAERSGVGVTLDVEAIPVQDGVAAVAGSFGVPVERFALAGGDDYELVIAIDPVRVDALRAAIAPTPLTVIGRMEGPPGLRTQDGRAIDAAGWDHFAS